MNTQLGSFLSSHSLSGILVAPRSCESAISIAILRIRQNVGLKKCLGFTGDETVKGDRQCMIVYVVMMGPVALWAA